MLEQHPLDLDGPAIFGCAQAGCQGCLEALLRRHEGLVHFLLHLQARGGMPYTDLAQVGRIALWQAVLRFDPHRGVAFSTFAGLVIKQRMWTAIARAGRQRRRLPLPEPIDRLQVAEEAWQQADVHAALLAAVDRLPDRLREILIARYGLDGQPCRKLKTIAQQLGLSCTRIGQLHSDALVLLRLPAYSARLRCLCGQDSRAAYARSEALSRAWLQRQHRRKH